MKNLKKLFLSTILSGFLACTPVFAANMENAATEQLSTVMIYNEFSSDLNVNYINPNDGINSETAKNLIDSYLKENNIEYLNSSDIKEITVVEMWENCQTQIFINSKVNYVAFVQGEKIIGLFSSTPMSYIYEMYLSDINSDNSYELCLSVSFGSGIVDNRIGVYDIKNQKQYELQNRTLGHYKLALNAETNRLEAYKTYYSSADKVSIGELVISDGVLTGKAVAELVTKDTLPFNIDNLSLIQNGKELSSVLNNNEKFTVRVDMTKLKSREGQDNVVIAVYDNNGAVLDMYYQSENFITDGGFSFWFDINPNELSKPIASVKVYVFDDFSNLEPLANCVSFD